MPDIIVQCKPLWYPEGNDPLTLPAGPATSYKMAEWLVAGLPKIVNDIDGFTGDDAISTEQVWADFVLMSAIAINASDVRIVIQPPQDNNLDFGAERARRVEIATQARDLLRSQLSDNADRIVAPATWEVEVLPIHASGFVVQSDGEVLASW